MKDITILVVDDEPEMREMIADYLTDSEGYSVLTAESGREALDEVLPNNKIDLILSDINMPEMKGFELLHEVREKYPEIKRMLITAYNVEDYFELALKYDVGNIFAKTTPFNFSELSSSIINLLTKDIFGPDRFFTKNGAKKQEQIIIKKSDQIATCAEHLVNSLPEKTRAKKLEVVLVELLTNAVFYGARDESPEDKTTWNHEFELSEQEAISIQVMEDEEKYAISIVDNGGKITKNDILFWLNRQSSRDENGMPIGVFDSHGRGLFIARRYIDRVVMNIDPNKKTEVIIINYLSDIYKGHKPLYINEL